MSQCSQCYSYAINPGHSGRDRKSDLDLCDVCYWRKRADELSDAKAERARYGDTMTSKMGKLEAENAALREYREEDAATIVNMAHEIMDLREDRERLDWLQERIFVVNYVRLDRVAGGLMVTENYGRSERDVEFNGDTLRAALDAEKENKGEGE